MLLIGQRVDDVQLRRRFRELLQGLLRIGPDHDAVHPAFEIPGDVFHRFASAQGDVRLKRHDVAAELTHGDFKRGSCPKRRLLEQQRDVPAVDRVGGRRLPAERALRFQPR